MKESHREGLATRSDPESCAVARKGEGEALTGARAGRALSREIDAPSREWRPLRGADAVRFGGRLYPTRRHRETRRNPARSKTPCMHGTTSHGNREVPRLSPTRELGDRIGKSEDVRR